MHVTHVPVRVAVSDDLSRALGYPGVFVGRTPLEGREGGKRGCILTER